MFAFDRQRKLSIMAFAAMLLNIGLNLMMIPYFQARYGNGGIGAALATLVTEFFLLVCATMTLPGKVFALSNLVTIVKGFGAGSLMLGAVAVLKDMKIPWTIQASTGVAVYAGAILLLRAVEKDDLKLVLNLVKSRKQSPVFTIPVEQEIQA